MFFIFCTHSPVKYTKNDITPLTESMKTQYYDDAAFLEYSTNNDSCLTGVLDTNNIQSYYNDLVFIYNNSYKINNLFFENVDHVHIFCTDILYNITMGVDTNKTWLNHWIDGEINTGINSIDTITHKFGLQIREIFSVDELYFVNMEAEVPFNNVAVINKYEETNEFIFIEPWVLVGDGSMITVESQDDYRIYTYSLNWGDCPSGCIYHHYWKVKIENDEVSLLEEGGKDLDL